MVPDGATWEEHSGRAQAPSPQHGFENTIFEFSLPCYYENTCQGGKQIFDFDMSDTT